MGTKEGQGTILEYKGKTFQVTSKYIDWKAKAAEKKREVLQTNAELSSFCKLTPPKNLFVETFSTFHERKLGENFHLNKLKISFPSLFLLLQNNFIQQWLMIVGSQIETKNFGIHFKISFPENLFHSSSTVE